MAPCCRRTCQEGAHPVGTTVALVSEQTMQQRHLPNKMQGVQGSCRAPPSLAGGAGAPPGAVQPQYSQLLELSQAIK